jgi:hypothetical protein
MTFFAPLAYVDVGYVSYVREIWLLFPWQALRVWSSQTGAIPAMSLPLRLPFYPEFVHELVVVWAALGAVLSLVVQRDLERFRYSVSLILSIIFLILQILFPLLFLSIAEIDGIYYHLIMPLPIPSATSLVVLLLVSRGSLGFSKRAG